MPEIHLRQPKFTYRTSGQFIRNKEIIQKLKEIGDSRYIYQKKLDKACFQHDMAYGDFKYISRKTASNKVLHDKGFSFAKNGKYDGYQRVLASMVYKCFNQKTSGSNTPGNAIKSKILQNKELAKELHKQSIRKFEK